MSSMQTPEEDPPVPNQSQTEQGNYEIKNPVEKKEKYVRVPVYTKEVYGSVPEVNPELIPKRIGAEFLILLAFGWLVLLIIYNPFKAIVKTPEQQAQEKKEILNKWYANTSHYNCESILEKKLRDPKSYEKIGNFITPKDNGYEKIITWEFRSKNGFGGYNPAIAMCTVTKENGGTVNATVLGQ